VICRWRLCLLWFVAAAAGILACWPRQAGTTPRCWVLALGKLDDLGPVQAGQRWHVERTSSGHNGLSRLQRCYERHEEVIEAFFDLGGRSSPSVA
jgi:hypothetical protein